MCRLAFLFLIVCLAAFPASAEFIKIKLPDGAEVEAYLYKPSGKGPNPGVIVLHHASGLTDSITNFSDDLRDKNFVTLAVNFDTGGGWLDSKVVAAYDYLQKLPEVNAHRIAIVGFSRGARFGVESAIFFKNEYPLRPIRAFVSYYMGNTLNVFPTLELPPILFLHGGLDSGIDASMIVAFCEMQKELGGVCEAKIYGGTSHAFIREASDHYDGSATADAFKRTVAFLNKHLRDTPIR